jgi:hypothetical protein
MFVDFHILNELGSPSINSNTFANRPPAGQIGRLFVSTDTYEIYRDNGSTWDLIGGPGSSTVTGTGAATQVAYWTASQAIGGSNNLWWDNTNKFLGIGINTPTAGVNVVQTDGLGILSEYTTVAGVGGSAVAIYARNTTNSSGYSGVFEEKTPNSAAGQYPIKIMHSLSSGTAAANMATGIHFSLPDDAGTERINQLSMDTVDPAAATYTSRYRFVLRNAGAAATPFYVTGAGLGVFVAAPSGLIHADGGANVARMILDADNNVARIFSFRTDNSQRWAFRVDGNETGSNAGANFAIRRYDDTGAFIESPLTIARSTGKSVWTATETYSTGVARGNYIAYNLTVPAGTTFSGPNAITALGANLNLQLQGNATIPSSARVGLDVLNDISFSGAGTLTMSQGGTLRTVSNLTTAWVFRGTAAGTITHLSGIKVLFPDNTGTAISVTNNYGILINNQDPGLGTVTYTNRWGIYQEGVSDLNYFAANTLIGTTVNNGDKLQVNGAIFTSNNTVLTNTKGGIFDFNDGQDAARVLAYKATGSNILFYTNPNGGSLTLAATINPSGNFGLGVTPSAWGSTSKVLEFSSGAIESRGSVMSMWTNAYYNGISPIYKTSAAATNYYQLNGEHIWLNAPSGTAGNVISFTQAMTLGANGFLSIGTTSATGGIDVWAKSNSFASFIGYAGTSSAVPAFAFFPYNINSNTGGLDIRTTSGGVFNNTMRLTDANNVLIGTTTDAGYKLQVNGDFYLKGSSGSSSFVLFSDYSAGSVGITMKNTAGNSTIDINGNAGNIDITGSYASGNPNGGTAGRWKFGSRVAAAVTLDATQYIEVDIGGTLYKLAIVI